MKKLLSLAFIATLFLVACGPDDDGTPTTKDGGGDGELTVSNEQRSILWYWTATWCGPCGSTGSPLFKDMMKENEGNSLIAIDLHSSNSSRLTPGYLDPADNSPKIAPSSGQLAANIRPNGFIPLFTLNNEFKGNSSVDKADIKTSVEAHNSVDAAVGVNASASVDGNNITINTSTKFFDAAEGEYHISVVLLENEVLETQNVSGVGEIPNFEHKKVMRASAVGGAMHTQQGISVESIATGSIAANTVVKGEYSIEYVRAELPTGFNTWEFDKDKTTAVVIVWKKNGALYDTVNAIEIDL